MKLELKSRESSIGELNLQPTGNAKKIGKGTYDGGFRISRSNTSESNEPEKRVVNSRSSYQAFTCK